MRINGHMLIGASEVLGKSGTVQAMNPQTAEPIPEPQFGMGGAREVELAASLATAAFDVYRKQPLERRVALLEAIAANIEALGDALIERAQQETGLSRVRLEGRARAHYRPAAVFCNGGTRGPLPARNGG